MQHFFPVRIYYEDTDAGGVVYHARYLHFFERARTEWLRNLGFSQHTLLAQSIAFVVKTISIDYKIAAHLDEQFMVETRVQEIKGAKIVFQQRLLQEERCFCEAHVIVVSVNLDKMKPISVPESIKQALAQAN